MERPTMVNVKTREKIGDQRLKPSEEPECKVSGGLLLALYMGKWLGVAPLSFSRRGEEFRARFCRRTYIAGSFFIILTCSLSLCGLVNEVSGDVSLTVRVKGGMTTVVWVMELMVYIIVTSIGAFGARSRMRKVVQIVIEMEKIISTPTVMSTANECYAMRVTKCFGVAWAVSRVDKQLCSLVVSKTSKSFVPVAASLLFALALFSVDYCYSANVFGYNFSIQKFYYMFFYIKYMASVIMLTQFALLALAVHAPLEALNTALEHQLHNLEECMRFEGKVQMSKYSKIVDTLSYSTIHPEISSDRLKSISLKCCKLFRLHSRVMELPQAVNKSHGDIVLVLLMILLLHLVETPYYIITDTCLVDQGESNLSPQVRCMCSLCLQLVWMLYHLASLSAIIEPCHWTTVQVSRTPKLVSKMLRASGSMSSLSRELMWFTSVLSASTFKYSPMGMCKLSRSLMVSIMGAVTTYLVILVQFQAINQNIT